MTEDLGGEKITETFNLLDLEKMSFGEAPEDITPQPSSQFKKWHKIPSEDFIEGDMFDHNWYQGDVDEEGRPDGKGVFIQLMVPEIIFSHFRQGKRHGLYTILRYDGVKFEGSYL